ncbi:hypothetical protein [Actinacidiphila yeochonensis]|uniref:hypothetical protein n=1 Tax=Actinacidiphila yeochonensis TaxID=89050 RepID=UPI000689EE6C|nr:hypothetical protein [Actinacidiphila yeochonensis]
MTLALPWTPDEVGEASDWLQRRIAERSDVRAALAALAETGRTRRVRNTAGSRLARLTRRRDHA